MRRRLFEIHRDPRTEPSIQDLPTLVASEAVGTGRRHYAWVVFGVAFFTLLATAGFRSTPGVLIDPLHHEFGWSRGTVGAAVKVPYTSDYYFYKARPGKSK